MFPNVHNQSLGEKPDIMERGKMHKIIQKGVTAHIFSSSSRAVMVLHLVVHSCVKNEKRACEKSSNPAFSLTSARLVNLMLVSFTKLQMLLHAAPDSKGVEALSLYLKHTVT